MHVNTRYINSTRGTSSTINASTIKVNDKLIWINQLLVTVQSENKNKFMLQVQYSKIFIISCMNTLIFEHMGTCFQNTCACIHTHALSRTHACPPPPPPTHIHKHPPTHLDFLWLDLGCLQSLDEIDIIHRATLRGAKTKQDPVLNLFQFLLHLRIADDQLVLGFLQVWPLLCHRNSQQLILQTAGMRSEENNDGIRWFCLLVLSLSLSLSLSLFSLSPLSLSLSLSLHLSLSLSCQLCSFFSGPVSLGHAV